MMKMKKLYSFALLLVMCFASHFRYGSVDWEQISGGNGRLVKFTGHVGLRYSSFSSVQVGDVITESDIMFTPDETLVGLPTGLELTVTSINPHEDWLVGVFESSHEYSTDGSFVASISGKSRIYSLLNSAGSGYRIASTVTVSRGVLGKSIQLSGIPLVSMVASRASTLSIASSESLNVQFRIADNSEANNGFQSYWKIPDLVIDSDTGVLSWAPVTKGYYTVQVIAESASSSTALDFTIQVIDGSSKRCKHGCMNTGNPCTSDDMCYGCTTLGEAMEAPLCDTNNLPEISNVKINGQYKATSGVVVYTAILGSTIELQVSGQDNDLEEAVFFSVPALPQGASVVVTDGQVGVSATYVMTWPTTVNDDSWVGCFSVSDSSSNPGASSVCIQILFESGGLDAHGDGLTYAVVGVQNTVTITNTLPSQTHTLVINGPSGTIQGIIEAGSSVYQELASYNVPSSSSILTKPGYHSLEVSDGLYTESYSLLVVPGATSPLQCSVYDGSTSGLLGGFSNSQVEFFVQAKDAYGNNVIGEPFGHDIDYPLGPDYDTFLVNVEYSSSVVESIGTHLGDGLWKLVYTVPTSVTLDTYNITVIHRLDSTDTTIGSYTNLDILTTQYSCTVTDLSDTIVAGEPFNFTIVSTDGQSGHELKVLITGIDDSNITITDMSSGEYLVQVDGVLTTAGEYIDVIRISALGMLDVVDESLIIVPSSVSPSHCKVGKSGIEETHMGHETDFEVTLYDEFDNLITSDSTTITVSGFFGDDNMTWSDDKYTFKYTRYKAQDFSISILINGDHVANSPYTVLTEPGSFSFLYSTVAGDSSVVAGSVSSFIVNAHDDYGNDRLPKGDSWKVYSIDAQGQENTTFWDSSSISSKYYFTFTSSTIGKYTLIVKVYVPEESTFITFKEIPILVEAAPVDSTNSNILGSGLQGGEEDLDKILYFQSKDEYDNIVDNAGNDAYFIQLDFKDTSEHYLATFNQPGSVESHFGVNELNLIEYGYWSVEYPVPHIGNSTYNLTVFYTLNSSLDSNGNFSNTIELNETVVVFSNVLEVFRFPRVVPVVPGSGDKFFDNWLYMALVIGGSVLVFTALVYGGWRLYRYRSKYHEQRARAASAKKHLDDMDDEVAIIPGGRDYEAVGAGLIHINPLHSAYQIRNANQVATKEALPEPEDIIVPEPQREAVRFQIEPKLNNAVPDSDMN